MSRSVFLKLCGAALVGGALPEWSSPSESPVRAGAAPATDSGAARFRPHVGSSFTIVGDGDHRGQRIHLAGVAETFASPGVEQYALEFTGTAQRPLPHGLYTFRHASLGDVDMFITPVGAPAGDPVYQACFSRLIRPEAQLCRISS